MRLTPCNGAFLPLLTSLLFSAKCNNSLSLSHAGSTAKQPTMSASTGAFCNTQMCKPPKRKCKHHGGSITALSSRTGRTSISFPTKTDQVRLQLPSQTPAKHGHAGKPRVSGIAHPSCCTGALVSDQPTSSPGHRIQGSSCCTACQSLSLHGVVLLEQGCKLGSAGLLLCSSALHSRLLSPNMLLVVCR